MDSLMEFIRKSDFYTAPASTRYHSCHEGGLLEHTLNVYDRLVSKFNDELWKDKVDVGSDSLIIAALLHDLCKCYFYGTELKNKKEYSDKGTKSDSNGRFDWVTVPSYTVDDKIPYGHGEKSVMMVEEYIKLKPMERYAIRWHMGFSEPKENWNTLGTAMRKYPLILALHMADFNEAISDSAVAEFCENEIALLDKKAAKAKERAATKKAEADELMEVVAEALSEDFEPIAEIAGRIQGDDVTVAKVTYRLRTLVENGTARKEQITVAGGEGQKARKIMAYRILNG